MHTRSTDKMSCIGVSEDEPDTCSLGRALILD
jgi:hypothetical protein